MKMGMFLRTLFLPLRKEGVFVEAMNFLLRFTVLMVRTDVDKSGFVSRSWRLITTAKSASEICVGKGIFLHRLPKLTPEFYTIEENSGRRETEVRVSLPYQMSA